MTVNGIEIRLHNFKSYIDSNWIPLNGKIEITGENKIDGGSNGSGKSSILEALWVLVKQSKSETKPAEYKRYIREGSQDFSIDAKVICDNKEYFINSTKNGIQCDNAVKKGLSDLYYSFLLQGMPNSFANINPKERKEAISIDFDCDNLVERSINNLESGIIKVKEQITTTENNISVIDNKKTNLEYELNLKQNEHNLVCNKLASLPPIPPDFDVKNVTSQHLREERDSIENEIHKWTTERAELTSDSDLKKSSLINERNRRINAEITKKSNSVIHTSNTNMT